MPASTSTGSPSIEALARQPRVTIRRPGSPDPAGRSVVYWMQRAQRAVDNPALDAAIDAGNALGKPVVVHLGIVPSYPHGNLRHYRFLVEALPELEDALRKRRVGFALRPFPNHRLAPFCEEVGAALVIGDENPLRETEAWRRKAAEALRVPLWTVDADVVVPSRLLLKEQFAARTIRPRIHAVLDDYLVPGDEPVARVAFQPPRDRGAAIPFSLDPREDFLAGFALDRSVSPVTTFRGGSAEGQRRLQHFLDGAVARYDDDRNRPERPGTSELSPYLHFGHLGPRAVALAVKHSRAPQADKDAFIEQLIVRRELAINFVRYNPRYDSLAGCERWAKETLAAHAADPRPVLYSLNELESAATGDALWNAAQRQMVRRGWMHNYVRMYWGKKILEWSPSPEEAFARAVHLNDKYLLDGRDPNGYTGIAWSIGGKHDRPWFDRPIFGTIRYMSGASTGKKFDSKEFIRQNS